MKYIYSLFLVLLTITLIGCGGSDDSDSPSTSDANSIQTAIYTNDIQTKSLSLAYDTPANFTISLKDGSGNPMSGLDIEVVDENGLLTAPLFVQTGEDGKADVNITVKSVALNGTDGNLSLMVYTQDLSLGYSKKLVLPYAVQPWDMVLFNGVVEVRVPVFDNIEGSASFEAPPGISLQPAVETIASGITMSVSARNVTITYEGTLLSMDENGSYNKTIGIVDSNDTSSLSVHIITGDGTVEAPMPLRTYAELKSILPTDTTAHYILSDDITLDENWSVVDFNGTFDGDAHKVSVSGKPLFSTLNNAKVQNLTLMGTVHDYSITSSAPESYTTTDETVDTYGNIGLLSFKANNTTFSNITVDKDASISFSCATSNTSSYNAGLLAGTSNKSIFTNITLDGSVSLTNCIYGYIGMLTGNMEDANSSFITAKGSVTANYVGVLNMGGIAGKLSGTITDSSSRTALSTTNSSGAIYYITIGGLVGKSTTLTIERSWSESDIREGGYSGGLVGFVQGATTIYDSYSMGNINGTNAGGIAGRIDYGVATIQRTYVTGSITGSGIWGSGTASSSTRSYLKYNLALSKSVTGARISQYIWRANNVFGSDNYAYAEMLVNGTQHYSSDNEDPDGADVTPQGLTAAFFTDTLGWDETVWDLDFESRDYKLPILKSHNTEIQKTLTMPEHLKH